MLTTPAGVYTGMSDYRDGIGQSYVVVHEFLWDDAAGFYPQSSGAFTSSPGVVTYDELDLEFDDDTGRIWGIGCQTTGLKWVREPDFAAFAYDLDVDSIEVLNPTLSYGGVCFLELVDSDTGLATLCDGADGCASYLLDATTESIDLAPGQPYTALDLTYARTTEDTVVLAHSTGGADVVFGGVTWTVLTSHTVSSIDVSWRGDDLFVAAIVDDGLGPMVLLADGDPDEGPLHETFLAFDRAGYDLEPSNVGLHVDDDRIVIAASGIDALDDDAIGWAFLSF